MNFIFIMFSIFLKIADSQICEVCQNLVTEFHNGLKSSDKGNFGGGNTAWEEERLGSFATSETRLVHILDGLCPSSTKNIDKCHYMREDSEEYIEKWWFQVYRKENNANSLYDYLCINNIHACCPNNHYGKKCESCLYYDTSKDLMCSGHGQCLGNGTREGNGTCQCDVGYQGDMCNECAIGFYSTNKSECERCDPACVGCTGDSYSHCTSCTEGYQMMANGCEDLNECINQSICSSGKFCSNLAGSYECLSCNAVCKECTGNSFDQCVTCNDGYQLVGSVCEDVDECIANSSLCSEDGQKCTNTEGSYICECLENYERLSDGSCVVIAAESEPNNKIEL